MSMFTPNNDRQEKKNKVIDKLLEFFDKFFSIIECVSFLRWNMLFFCRYSNKK